VLVEPCQAPPAAQVVAVGDRREELEAALGLAPERPHDGHVDGRVDPRPQVQDVAHPVGGEGRQLRSEVRIEGAGGGRDLLDLLDELEQGPAQRRAVAEGAVGGGLEVTDEGLAAVPQHGPQLADAVEQPVPGSGGRRG